MLVDPSRWLDRTVIVVVLRRVPVGVCVFHNWRMYSSTGLRENEKVER